MCLEVGSLIKTSLTDGTPVWSLLVVEDFVNGQCPVLAETLATIITFKRFLFAVNVAMIPGIYSSKLESLFGSCCGECNGLP